MIVETSSRQRQRDRETDQIETERSRGAFVDRSKSAMEVVVQHVRAGQSQSHVPFRHHVHILFHLQYQHRNTVDAMIVGSIK